MARILIVGNSCRARGLAREFAAAGNVVRVTTRSRSGVDEIAATGAEAVIADPSRLATLLPHMQGVTVLYWLLGNAAGNAPDLHGPRLSSVLEKIVDSGVRGFAYEAAGTVGSGLLETGTVLVRDASARWHIPAELILQYPADHDAWQAEALAAFDALVSA